MMALVWAMAAGSVVGGCRSAGEKAARFEAATCAADLDACVEAVVAAHGGWQMFAALPHARYLLADLSEGGPWLPRPPWPVTPDGTFELRSDRLRPSFDAVVTAAGPVVTPTSGDPDAAAMALRLHTALRLPWALRDPGVTVLGATPDTLDGTNVVTLSVQMADQGRWLVHVDAPTMLVRGMTLDMPRGPRARVHWEGHWRVGPMWVPQRMVFKAALPGPVADAPWHTVHVLNATLHP